MIPNNKERELITMTNEVKKTNIEMLQKQYSDKELFTEKELKGFEIKMIQRKLTEKQNLVTKIKTESNTYKYLIKLIERDRPDISHLLEYFKDRIEKTPNTIQRVRIDVEKLKVRKLELELEGGSEHAYK